MPAPLPPPPPAEPHRDGALDVRDDRTGERYELPILDGVVPSEEIRKVKVAPDDFGLMPFDPPLASTATARSTICFIDGAAGVLNYRGYPIEQLAERSNYRETCWLVLSGELPTAAELEGFSREIAENTRVLDAQRALTAAMPDGAHPMSMLVALLAALGGEFPDGEDVEDAASRARQTLRLLALTPVAAALAHRRHVGLPLEECEPRPELSHAANLLHMLKGSGEPDVPPEFERAMDCLLVLHAEHELNCSTNAMRAVGSSLVNPYSAAASAAAALQGPLHGGANQAVLEMLDEIGSVEEVPAFLESVKAGERRLMGFGHRVYKNYDPRAKVIKGLAGEVFRVAGPSPRLAIAQALEEAALADDYFVSRKLFPNVDFYSGLIYAAMGFPPTFFTVFFAVARMVGWLAHWNEMMVTPKRRIVRPRQVYLGHDRRDWVPLDQRG